MYKVMGLCNLHHSPELGELTENRPLASTSFLGRYAFIDFALSNFSNSDIDKVGILVKNGPRSILKHLGSGNTWNANTKMGFESIMYNEKLAYQPRYNHDLNNIRANDWMFYDRRPDYFVIAPAHIIMAIDYRDVLKAHIASGADITLVYTHIKNGKSAFIGSDFVTVDQNEVIRIRENKGAVNEADISLETYVISREKMSELMLKASATSSFFGLNDIIAYTCGKSEKVHAYRFDGYVRCFDSLQHYVEYSLELLDYGTRSQLFKPGWPIYTVTHDTPPSRYGKDAEVKDSFIANGAVIDGKVSHSILSRYVTIGPDVTVKDAIILTDSVITGGAVLNHAVVDKYAHIIHAQKIEGKEDNPIYIKQGDVI